MSRKPGGARNLLCSQWGRQLWSSHLFKLTCVKLLEMATMRVTDCISQHSLSVHFVLMTHMKYLCFHQKKKKKPTTLFTTSQSTEQGRWNQPELVQDPCRATKELNDLEKVLQPFWASLSSDQWGDLCPPCPLPTDSTSFQKHTRRIPKLG